MSRCCTSCQRNLPRASFSKNQWRKGIGSSRCSSCIHGGGRQTSAAETPRLPTARKNNATTASFTRYDLANPFEEGTFRHVAKGTYTEGQRSGEQCVCKWFKTGSVYEAEFFDTDIKSAGKSLNILEEFNNGKFVDKVIRMNEPQVWTFNFVAGSDWGGKKVLQEPYIEGYQKFNSNSGWADDSTPWPRVMQALSHFSYHQTGGQLVLCDLQGGCYRDGVVLTDPVILSRVENQYGVTDLGPKGILNFFHHHVCNEFCKSQWSRPKNTAAHFQKTSGTSMVLAKHAPTHASRHYMTGYAVVHEEEEEDY